MLENLLSSPMIKNGCIEEMVILHGSKEVLKYSFSNSLDNIKTAIFARTGRYINIEKAVWKQNPKLSISVKHLMNHHNVNYAMSTDIRNKERYIAVNMRVGDNWYITGYDEINGKFVSWDLLDIFDKLQKLLAYINDKENTSSDDEDDEDDE